MSALIKIDLEKYSSSKDEEWKKIDLSRIAANDKNLYLSEFRDNVYNYSNNGKFLEINSDYKLIQSFLEEKFQQDLLKKIQDFKVLNDSSLVEEKLFEEESDKNIENIAVSNDLILDENFQNSNINNEIQNFYSLVEEESKSLIDFDSFQRNFVPKESLRLNYSFQPNHLENRLFSTNSYFPYTRNHFSSRTSVIYYKKNSCYNCFYRKY